MTERTNPGAEYLVLRHPHFERRGAELFFMASRRPARLLSAAELDIWDALEQPAGMQMLRGRFPGQADAVVPVFYADGLCELAEPAFAAARRRVLVIEPHADDAALSLGGVMWSRRHSCAFTVATMASRSNFTSYYDLERDYFEVARVMDIRRRESELFARMIGGAHVDAGLTDAALRYRDADWSLDFFRRHHVSISVATSRSADAQERERWLQAARRILQDNASDEVWIPLGSPHVDHRLTMDACLSVIAAQPALLAGRTLRIYQDVPYAAQYPAYTRETLHVLERAGAKLEPEVVSIEDAFDSKLRLVSLYASQFKLAALRADIETSARLHGAAPAEQLWRVASMPAHTDFLSIADESAAERGQEESAAAWAARNHEVDCVRVLLLVPTGQWATDIELLGKTFPRARFEIHAAPAAAAEVEATRSTRADIVDVGTGSRAWLKLGLRLCAARPLPTLFHAGQRRLRAAGWLARLWLLSDTLLVSSMNAVARGLARAPAFAAGRLETRS